MTGSPRRRSTPARLAFGGAVLLRALVAMVPACSREVTVARERDATAATGNEATGDEASAPPFAREPSFDDRDAPSSTALDAAAEVDARPAPPLHFPKDATGDAPDDG